MKRLLTTAAMFLCCMATSFAQFSGSGSGTENDPYLIMNPIQLNQLRNYLNQSGVYFKLMANIDLTEFLEDENPDQGWQPVGISSSAAFKAILDGNGKTITGLWIKRSSTDNVGFFGYTDGATIKNVNIEASVIEGKGTVGGVSGYSQSTTISGCSFSGSIKGTTNVGGYVGNSGDNLILSDNIAKVSVSGTGDNVGGFIGRNDAYENLFISGCTLNDGTISGANDVGGCCGANVGNHSLNNYISTTYIHANISGTDYVGGLCGISDNYVHTLNLNSCGFSGEITGASHVGGLIGKILNTYRRSKIDAIQKSFAIGAISATGDYVGGLIGDDVGYYYYYYYSYSFTNLSDNYHSGPVTGSNYVGGLIGYKLYGEVSNCYSVGSVAGARYVGGLIGFQEGSTIKKSVAINTRVTATVGDVNRVVGLNKGTIGAMGSPDENKSYNRTIVISQGVAQDVTDNEMNGTNVSATTLKLKATYVAMGWDFDNTWEIQETECYPYMKSQTAPPVITSQVVSGATVISGKCVDGGIVTLFIDGEKQEKVSTGNSFTFTVSPLQAGHEVRLSAKAEGKEQSYYTTVLVSFLGKGTEADPYQVYTPADLSCVYYKGYYKLMNDIDLTSYINQYSPTEGWQSIGREGSETVYFDGNGHKITGLWCNSTRENTGLFSCFANGYIKDLTVVTASDKQVKGTNCTGILIGKLIDGQLENCKVEGTVSGTTLTGGMIGLLSGGSIKKCQANVNVSSETKDTSIGGIVGELSGTIDQCLTKGSVAGTGANIIVGGIAGTGKTGSAVSNCYSTALINSAYCAAGIVGYNYGVVEKCYASGNIFSQNYGAGVVGYNDGSEAVVRYCAAMSKKLEVTYESQQTSQGGGYGQRIIGGIKNGAPSPETSANYALKTMQVSVNDVAQKVYDDIMNGTAKTGTELMAQATYEALTWDFTNTWKIEEGKSYPYIDTSEGGSDDPGSDPVITTSDALSVENIATIGGATLTVDINLKNVTTDYTGYQFDLVLPEGFEIAKNEKGKLDFSKGDRYEDETQQLSIESLGNNTYRFLSFSMSNGLIEGNDGAIVSFTLQVASGVAEGDYSASLKNIVFTESDGTQSQMEDTTFKITISNVIKGDANGDGKVNVSDIVEIVNYILGKPSDKFNKIAADMSGDGDVNVTDIVRVVSIILSADNVASSRRAANCASLVLNDHEITLKNAENYTAAQFDINLSDGQSVGNISLNSNSDHNLTWRMVNAHTCRVIAYSMTNAAFEANGRALLNIMLVGNQGNVTLSNELLVSAAGSVTGINLTTADNEDGRWYSIDGRKLSQKPSQKGIYIKNGKKYMIK